MQFSIISPVYASLNALPELVERSVSSMHQMGLDSKEFEIILVDDCGPGNPWEIIEGLSKEYPQVKGIKLSRNFGQHYAISAGLEHSQGEWIVVMDCDLQDQPEEIAKLYKKAQEGYEIVWAKRHERKHSFFKQLGSRLFYTILSYLTGLKYDHQVANFGIYHRKVINAIVELKEHIRFFPSMVRWVGFKSTSINVEHAKRMDGESSYNFSKLFNLALDIMLAYSDKPLRLAVKLGLTISLAALVVILITIVRYFMGLITVEGYLSIILSVWLLGGLIIFILGMVGLYIGKTFEGVKERPLYIVDKKTNF